MKKLWVKIRCRLLPTTSRFELQLHNNLLCGRAGYAPAKVFFSIAILVTKGPTVGLGQNSLFKILGANCGYHSLVVLCATVGVWELENPLKQRLL